MVEFALVAPLLFVLLFGIIEFGVILYDQAVITNVSREGARFAATYYINPSPSNNEGAGTPRWCSDVQNYVQNWMVNNATLISLTSSPPTLKGCCGSKDCIPSYTWPANGSPTGLDIAAGGAGNTQWIKVSYDYNLLVFGSLIQLLNGSVSPTWTITGITVMRDENQN
jgi:hypothetical protein